MSSLNNFPQKRLKYVVTINDESLPEDTDPELIINYVDIGNVDSSGQINKIESFPFLNAPSRARRVARPGDVIVSTVRTYLQAIAPIRNEHSNLIVSTGFAVIRPKDNIISHEYCKYALRESQFLHEVQLRSTGVSYPAINTSELSNISICVPLLSKQKAIVKFLDKEIGTVDGLIATRKQQLILLAEKRSTLISNAITNSIYSNVIKKDSGVEWLGQIPENWQIERSRWLFQERNERSQNGEEELLTVSHITGVTLRSEKDVNMFEAETNEGYKICKSGDLVINTLWAWMGAMGVAPMNGIVSPAYHVYTPQKALLPEYVDAIVRTPMFASEVTRYSKGVWSSRLRLYPEGFYETYWPVPPIEEQAEIVAYIKSEVSKIDSLRIITEDSIKLLNEKRSTLITAAVTGQINLS
jgi:type I restriction enzyme S subunit